MKKAKGSVVIFVLIISIAIMKPSGALAQQNSTPKESVSHDGQHDFDFNIGAWRTHIRRLVHPPLRVPKTGWI